MDNDKLKYAQKVFNTYGVDPDEIMMLDDKEYQMMMGINPRENELNEQLFLLSEEARELTQELHDIEIENNSIQEELEKDIYTEIKTEMYSDLAYNKIRIEEIKKRLGEIRDLLKQYREELLSLTTGVEASEDDEQYYKPNEQVEGQISIFDLQNLNIEKRLAEIASRKESISSEIIATEEAKKSIRDYMYIVELNQELTNLHYELNLLLSEERKLMKEYGINDSFNR